MAQILFFLNCVLGAFGDSQIFTVTRDKIVCVKHMRLNARRYVQGYLAFKYLPFFCLLPALAAGGGLPAGRHAFAGRFGVADAAGLPHAGRRVPTAAVRPHRQGDLAQYGVQLGHDRGGGSGHTCPWAGAGSWGAVLLHPACAVPYALLGGAALWYIALGYRVTRANSIAPSTSTFCSPPCSSPRPPPPL